MRELSFDSFYSPFAWFFIHWTPFFQRIRQTNILLYVITLAQYNESNIETKRKQKKWNKSTENVAWISILIFCCLLCLRILKTFQKILCSKTKYFFCVKALGFWEPQTQLQASNKWQKMTRCDVNFAENGKLNANDGIRLTNSKRNVLQSIHTFLQVLFFRCCFCWLQKKKKKKSSIRYKVVQVLH